MRQLALAFVLIAALIATGIAQESNPNTWTKNQAEKILNNSAWGQTQTETDLSEMVYTPTTGGGARPSEARPLSDRQTVSNNRSERGATNQAISVNYHVRLLSAKPIRQAFKRVIELAQGNNKDQELLEGLDAFVKRDFSRFVVVAVTVDSTDSRFSGPVLQAFNSAGLQSLKNKAYLERKDGKRVFVTEYHAPISDGLGAKFIFPRIVDEKRFVEPDSGTLRFYCELSSQIKLNVTFKVAELMYDGKLEY